MNNLMIFEWHDVEVFELNGQILFNPYHVGAWLELGDSAVKMAIAKMNEKQVVKLTNSKVNKVDFRKLHNTGENSMSLHNQKEVHPMYYSETFMELYNKWLRGVTEMTIPTMITIKEAAEKTGISYSRIRTLCLEGKIVHIKAGRRFLINLEKLIEYLNTGEQWFFDFYILIVGRFCRPFVDQREKTIDKSR